MAGYMVAGNKALYKEMYTACTVTSWGGWGALVTKDSVLPNASTLPGMGTAKGQYLECTLSSSTLMTTIKALKKCAGEYVYFQPGGQLDTTPFSANEGETILERQYDGGILLVFVK